MTNWITNHWIEIAVFSIAIFVMIGIIYSNKKEPEKEHSDTHEDPHAAKTKEGDTTPKPKTEHHDAPRSLPKRVLAGFVFVIGLVILISFFWNIAMPYSKAKGTEIVKDAFPSQSERIVVHTVDLATIPKQILHLKKGVKSETVTVSGDHGFYSELSDPTAIVDIRIVRPDGQVVMYPEVGNNNKIKEHWAKGTIIAWTSHHEDLTVTITQY
jgi:hypothetical protein